MESLAVGTFHIALSKFYLTTAILILIIDFSAEQSLIKITVRKTPYHSERPIFIEPSDKHALYFPLIVSLPNHNGVGLHSTQIMGELRHEGIIGFLGSGHGHHGVGDGLDGSRVGDGPGVQGLEELGEGDGDLELEALDEVRGRDEVNRKEELLETGDLVFGSGLMGVVLIL